MYYITYDSDSPVKSLKCDFQIGGGGNKVKAEVMNIYECKSESINQHSNSL